MLIWLCNAESAYDRNLVDHVDTICLSHYVIAYEQSWCVGSREYQSKQTQEEDIFNKLKSLIYWRESIYWTTLKVVVKSKFSFHVLRHHIHILIACFSDILFKWCGALLFIIIISMLSDPYLVFWLFRLPI